MEEPFTQGSSNRVVKTELTGGLGGAGGAAGTLH